MKLTNTLHYILSHIELEDINNIEVKSMVSGWPAQWLEEGLPPIELRVVDEDNDEDELEDEFELDMLYQEYLTSGRHLLAKLKECGACLAHQILAIPSSSIVEIEFKYECGKKYKELNSLEGYIS